MKILIFAGTRPEAIKLAPIVRELIGRPASFQVKLCNTGQHEEMIEQAFKDFGISPDINLQVMRPEQTLAKLSARLFDAIDNLLEFEKPDWVVLQGDTTTAMVVSLCAFYRNIKIGHIEAGLRSFNRRAPFPEEINRRVTGILADLHFAPTQKAKENLLREGVHPDTVFVTGNTVIDAFLWTLEQIRRSPLKLPDVVETGLAKGQKIILITGHRRENFGIGLENICQSVKTLAGLHPDVLFVYPVHLNPNVRETVYDRLNAVPGVCLTDPLPYKQFVRLVSECTLILTDSGGIQEEAPSVGKPVLVMRDVTERPEGIEAGTSRLVGNNPEKIVQEVSSLLKNPEAYAAMAATQNPFGDGKASRRIVEIMISQSSRGSATA